jgi:protein-L-isoaspartate(D-aspartate) O-methyltransferase
MRVLEIGAGSGYQTAILARLAEHVYAVEAHEELARQAKSRLLKLGLENVTLRVGDGAAGWPEAAPFDRILAAAAAPAPPDAWWDQLAEGGRIVAPLGAAPSRQKLVLIEKAGGCELRRELMPVRFVPLLSPKIAGSH